MSADEKTDEHAVSVSDSIADPLIGALLDGKYEVQRLIAAGAMGRVFEARHASMDTRVAVKTMHLHLLRTEAALERFKREAVLCGALHHPGIVRVLSCGVSTEGEPYLVMDFLDGENLAAVLARGPLSLPKFFSIFRVVIDALACAHEQGIVHRDLKPGNILIVGDKPVIIDFGIARAVEASSDQKITQTGAVIGTSAYMSPEQCTTGNVDARSDIYSLGCVMYEALVGQPPFQGDSALDVMYKHLNQSLSDLGELNALPSELSKIVIKCLAKSPADRYQSMHELAKDFESCEAGAGKLKFRRAASRRTLVVGAALLLVIAAGSIAYYVHTRPRPSSVLAQKPASLRVLEPGKLKILPDNSRQVVTYCEIYRASHSDQDAVDLSCRWLAKYGKDPVKRYECGDVQESLFVSYLNLRNFEAGERAINQSIANSVNATTALYRRQVRVRLYTELHEFETLISECKAMLKDPLINDHPQLKLNVYCDLSLGLRGLGRRQEAAEVLRQAESYAKKTNSWDDAVANAHLRREKAYVQALTGHPEQAVQTLNELAAFLELRRDSKPNEYMSQMNANAGILMAIGRGNQGMQLQRDLIEFRRRRGELIKATPLVYDQSAKLPTIGKQKEAEQLLIDLLNVQAQAGDPDESKTRQLLAAMYFSSRRFKECMAQNEVLLTRAKGMPTDMLLCVIGSQADCLLQTRSLSEALRFVEGWMKFSTAPDYLASMYIISGDLNQRMGFISVSETYYKKAAEYAVRMTDVAGQLKLSAIYGHMADNRFNQQLYDENKQYFTKAMKALEGSQNYLLVNEKRNLLTRLSLSEISIHHDEDALKAANDHVALCKPWESVELLRALTCRGQVLSQMSQFDKAKKDFEQALVLVKSLEDVLIANYETIKIRRAQAELETNSGHYEKARKDLLALLTECRRSQLQQEEASTLLSLLTLSSLTQNLEDGVKFSRQLRDLQIARLGICPESAYAACQYGSALARAGKHEEALKTFEDSLKMCQNDERSGWHKAYAYYCIAQTYEKLHNLVETEKYLRLSATTYEALPSALYACERRVELGDMLVKQGRYAEAVKEYILGFERAAGINGFKLRADNRRVCAQRAIDTCVQHHLNDLQPDAERCVKEFQSETKKEQSDNTRKVS